MDTSGEDRTHEHSRASDLKADPLDHSGTLAKRGVTCVIFIVYKYIFLKNVEIGFCQFEI